MHSDLQKLAGIYLWTCFVGQGTVLEEQTFLQQNQPVSGIFDNVVIVFSFQMTKNIFSIQNLFTGKFMTMGNNSYFRDVWKINVLLLCSNWRRSAFCCLLFNLAFTSWDTQLQWKIDVWPSESLGLRVKKKYFSVCKRLISFISCNSSLLIYTACPLNLLLTE